MVDDLDEQLGIDRSNPLDRLAAGLVESDYAMLDSLVELRKKRGMSEFDVAERMGYTEVAVRAFEASNADPRLSTIRRYAMAIGAVIQHEVYPDGA